MSNVALYDPDQFRGGIQEEFAHIDHTEYTTLGDLIGASMPVIGIQGGKWSLRVGGQEYFVKLRLPDGTMVHSPHLDVVFLREAPFLSKSWYKDGYPGPGSHKPPDCSALQGRVPDAGAPLKQAESCALCPRNERKLQPNGREGKECRDYARACVVLWPGQVQIEGKDFVEPVFLRIPPDSFKNRKALTDQMGPNGRGLPFYTYITRMTFEEGLSHQRIVFRALKKLDPGSAKFVAGLMADPEVKRITGEAGGFGAPRLVGPAPQQAMGEAAPEEGFAAVAPARPQQVIEAQPATVSGFSG